MGLLNLLRTVHMPHSLKDPTHIKQARELEALGYIEARFMPPSKGRSDFGEERGAVVIRITPAGMAIDPSTSGVR